jgi:hypothetical protein
MYDIGRILAFLLIFLWSFLLSSLPSWQLVGVAAILFSDPQFLDRAIDLEL